MNVPARTSRYARAIGWPFRYPPPPVIASERSTTRAAASPTTVLTACTSTNNSLTASPGPAESGYAASCASSSAAPRDNVARAHARRALGHPERRRGVEQPRAEVALHVGDGAAGREAAPQRRLRQPHTVERHG